LSPALRGNQEDRDDREGETKAPYGDRQRMGMRESNKRPGEGDAEERERQYGGGAFLQDVGG
jgi:hypothetical protein